MMDERIVELETRLAFQDSTLQELNVVLTEQQQQIDGLRDQINQLLQRIDEMSQPTSLNPADEPPPPHY